MNDIYIVAGVRTPFGKYRGGLRQCSALMLGQTALSGMLKQVSLAASQVDAVFLGNVLSAGLGQNLARQVALASGLSVSSQAVTINEVCGSSLKALRLAEAQMRLGDAGLVAVGGAESMTQAPEIQLAEAANQAPVATMMQDGLRDAFSQELMGVTAEKVAERYQVSRAEMDEFACRSQQKAAAAWQRGFFNSQVIPTAELDHDEGLRPETNVARLSQLKPIFQPAGRVTAGNASPVSDGAAMLLLATPQRAAAVGLAPLGVLGAYAEVGVDPNWMGYAPYHAIKALLRKTGQTLADYDWIEVNEAFAAPCVAIRRDLDLPADGLNPVGGAIALGHPLAASGARLVLNALAGLKEVDGRRALVSLCIGGGLAIAYEIKRVLA